MGAEGVERTLGPGRWLCGVPVSPSIAQPLYREGLLPNGSGVHGMQPPSQRANTGLGLPGAELWSWASGMEARRAVFTPCGHMFSEEEDGLKKKKSFSCKMKSKERHSSLKNGISVRRSAWLPTQRRFKSSEKSSKATIQMGTWTSSFLTVCGGVCVRCVNRHKCQNKRRARGQRQQGVSGET